MLPPHPSAPLPLRRNGSALLLPHPPLKQPCPGVVAIHGHGNFGYDAVVGRELTLPRLRVRPRPRIDLLLRAPGGDDVPCEVKSVGAARDGVALFPDAPTLRGLRHLALLARRARRGLAAGLVLCAQRGDVRAIAADETIDPAFARALRSARRAGVVIAGMSCAAHPGGMELLGPVPVL